MTRSKKDNPSSREEGGAAERRNRRQALALGGAAAAAAMAVLAAAGGWFAAAGPTQALQESVSIGSATVAPAGTVTVSLDAVAPAAGIGSIDATVTYDTAVVNATDCTPNADWDVGDCTIDPAAGTVRLIAADVAGLASGSLATITFQAVGAAGTSSALDVQVDIFALPDESSVTPTVNDGTITVEGPTATPTPAPTAVPVEFLRTYSAKFLRGTFTGDVEGPVEAGNYATAINVHNLQDSPVEFTKKAVLSAREDEPRSPPTSPIALTLDPDEALEIDCPDIRQLLGLPQGEEFIKGFVIIRSDSVEIDVVAVYTARFLDNTIQCLTKAGELEPPDEGACPKGSAAIGLGQGGGMSIDVEYIQAKPGPASGTGGDVLNTPATLAGTSFGAAILAVGLTIGAFRLLTPRINGRRGDSGEEEEES